MCTIHRITAGITTSGVIRVWPPRSLLASRWGARVPGSQSRASLSSTRSMVRCASPTKHTHGHSHAQSLPRREYDLKPFDCSRAVCSNSSSLDARYDRSAQVDSATALKYPTDSEVSLARKFVAVNEPWMRGVLTDTHFKQRDRCAHAHHTCA